MHTNNGWKANGLQDNLIIGVTEAIECVRACVCLCMDWIRLAEVDEYLLVLANIIFFFWF
jgi:hypothetical protein